MNVYVDASVVLRVVLGERRRLADWPRIGSPATSDLTHVECLRTIDRARLAGKLDDDEIARVREAIDEVLSAFDIVSLDRRILRRAAEPLPTTLGTLDAIHLASALALRMLVRTLRFATHDDALGVAARAVGFRLVA